MKTLSLVNSILFKDKLITKKHNYLKKICKALINSINSQIKNYQWNYSDLVKICEYSGEDVTIQIERPQTSMA